MRVLIKELKKIFSLRIVLILALFSAVYFYISIQITDYRTDLLLGTNSVYDVPFYEELVQEYGATLSIDEWDSLMDKRTDMEEQLEELIKQDKILSESGIDTLDKFYKEDYRLSFSSDLTEEETEIYDKMLYLHFGHPDSSKIFFRLQIISSMEDFRGYAFFFADEKSAKKYLDPDSSKLMQERELKQRTRSEVSLLPYSVLKLIDHEDCVRLPILAVICCFVLIVPFPIGEKLRGVFSIYASTKTGRRIFNKQLSASVLTGTIVAVIFAAIYTFMLWLKKVFFFKDCPIFTYAGIWNWFDITFGQLMLMHLAAFMLITVSASVLAYLVGRLANNYITGIAVSIPAAAAYCALTSYCSAFMFDMNWEFWLCMMKVILGIIVPCLAIFITAFFVTKRDKVRDML